MIAHVYRTPSKFLYLQKARACDADGGMGRNNFGPLLPATRGLGSFTRARVLGAWISPLIIGKVC